MIDPKLFDTLLEPIFILDQDGRVTYCNEAAALVTELSVRKLLRGKPRFRDLIRFQDTIPALMDLSALTDPSPYTEVSFNVESGKEGRVQLTVQKFSEDPSYIVFFRDVTLEETLQRKYRAELEKKEDVIRALEVAHIKLEDYSRNLEKMVEERTLQLSQLNQRMKALLDSLDQGFLIFDSQGRCSDVASKACQTTLSIDPRGLDIGVVLRLDTAKEQKFRKWMNIAFQEMLPFEDVAPLAPPRFYHPEALEISLSYYPLRNDANSIEGIVIVATDITNLIVAQKEAEKERAYAKMVVQMVRQKRQIQSFLFEARNLISELAIQVKAKNVDYELTFRSLHTLKGGAASFSIHGLVQTAHHAEELLTNWKDSAGDSSKAESYLKEFQLTTERLPSLLEEFAFEFGTIIGKSNRTGEPVREVSSKNMIEFYTHLAHDQQLRDQFYEWFLLEPIGELFVHYNDVIQQIASDQEKIVAPLEVEPIDFQLWPLPYERLLASFVHAFRNAIDHGIELASDRELKGKLSSGRIGIRCAKAASGQLQIQVWDDGNGIDPSRIRQKLENKGLPHSHESDEQVIQHVFDSEFSTRDQVTEISGRGVGMDAIKAEAVALGGTVRVESKLGSGTTVFIEVPWMTEVVRDRRAA